MENFHIAQSYVTLLFFPNIFCFQLCMLQNVHAILPTSPVKSTGRFSFAALSASNLLSSSALMLSADQLDAPPFQQNR